MKSIYLSIVATPTAAMEACQNNGFRRSARGHCPRGCSERAD